MIFIKDFNRKKTTPLSDFMNTPFELNDRVFRKKNEPSRILDSFLSIKIKDLFIKWVFFAQLYNFISNSGKSGVISSRCNGSIDNISNRYRIGFIKATSSDGGCTKTKTRWIHWLTSIKRNSATASRNAYFFKSDFRF